MNEKSKGTLTGLLLGAGIGLGLGLLLGRKNKGKATPKNLDDLNSKSLPSESETDLPIIDVDIV